MFFVVFRFSRRAAANVASDSLNVHRVENSASWRLQQRGCGEAGRPVEAQRLRHHMPPNTRGRGRVVGSELDDHVRQSFLATRRAASANSPLNFSRTAGALNFCVNIRATTKPTLCRVSRYFLPGFPKPTINFNATTPPSSRPPWQPPREQPSQQPVLSRREDAQCERSRSLVQSTT